MVNKVEKIVALLIKHPKGLKAREISNELAFMDKKEVNQILYGNQSIFTAKDYIWTLVKNETIPQEREYKQTEINKLKTRYNTPYSETDKLLELDIVTFKRAVKHAKDLSVNYLTYSISEKWIDFVSLPDDIFQIRKNYYKKIRDIAQKRNQEKLKQELLEKQRLQLEREKAIRELCENNNLSNDEYIQLLALDLPVAEIEKRLSIVLYYKRKYYELGISIPGCVSMPISDFNTYINKKVVKQSNVCYGNCASCCLEKCLMEK